MERKSPEYRADIQRDKISEKSQETGETDRGFNRKWTLKKIKEEFSQLKKAGVFRLK